MIDNPGVAVEPKEEEREQPELVSLSKPVKKTVRCWLRAHRVELMLFLLLWFTYAYFYQSTQHNEAARFDQARAIFQDHTLLINKYWWNTADVIHLSSDGGDHIYPAKAPGMSLVAVPPFAFFSVTLKAFRAFGLPEWVYWHLVTYLSIVFTVSLLSALCAVLIYRVLMRITGDSYLSVLVILAVWLGTIAFPFSTVFFSHQLSAALLAIAFYFLFKLRLGEVASLHRVCFEWFGAGFLLGFSAANEYPTAILAALLSFYGLWILTRAKMPMKSKAIVLGVWVLGGLIAGGTLIGYNLIAFGKPFYLAYEALSRADSPFPTHTHGLVGFQWLGFRHFLHAVASFMIYPPVGLLYISVQKWGLYACNPVLWLTIPGLAIMIWKKEWRVEGLLVAAMAAAYILFISCYGTSIYDWAGASYLGPRHIIPLLPFLALPLYFGARIRYLRFLFYPLLAISVFYMLLATAIEPRVPLPFEIPSRDFLLPDYLRGKLAQNTLNLFDPSNRNLTKDSTAFNLPKLAGCPGRYQLAPLMLWWLIAGRTLLSFAAKTREDEENETIPTGDFSVPQPESSRCNDRGKYRPQLAAGMLFVFVSAIAVAPVIHYARRFVLQGDRGLLGRYYQNEHWSGEPVDVQIDPAINFDWSKSWPLPPPFSIEWTGNLVVEQPGEYTFTLIADDGALFEIDRQVVVDVTKGPMLIEQNGTINLGAGLHRVRVRYFNILFGGSVRLYWTLSGRPREVIPSESFIPDKVPGTSLH